MTDLASSSRRSLALAALAASTLAVLPALAAVTGSGRVQTENRALAPFEAISVSGPIELDVRQTEQQALSLTGDDNVLPLVETVVEPGRHGPTLLIRLKRGTSISTGKPIKARIDVVRLTALAAAGSGDVRVGELHTPSLNLSIAGSGDARLQALKTDSLETRIAGSGSVQAQGTAGRAKLSISGSGSIDLMPLVADDVTVSIAGSGDAKVTANKSLKVSIAGSGDVVWSGSAVDVKSSVAGSGHLTRR
jgi:hypothetical protein